MKHNKQSEETVNEYIDLKSENKEFVERKQSKEAQVRNKRKQLREAIEDRDYQ